MTEQIAVLAQSLGVDDVLVLERIGDGLRLQGGYGRGASWAGTVDVEIANEPLLCDAAPNRPPLRLAGDDPQRVVGPYWSKHATIVAVGGDHVVILGARAPIRLSDGELRRHAAEAAASVGGVPSSKLLADELEVVEAVRQLMQYRPEVLQDTARHIAQVAAAALACEFSAVLVRGHDGLVVQRAGATPDECADPQLCADMQRLERRVQAEPLLEQDIVDEGRTGRAAGLVSRYALPLGSGGHGGVLVVGHAADRPRGFTSLCQRIGQAIADASDVLLSQAAAREELRAERDRFALQARTDELTGLANRVAWSEALAAERVRMARYGRPVAVMSVDIDRLKQTNDRFGHEAGDELLAGAARVLLHVLRDTDMVARIGGDEFGVLLPETEADAMDKLVERIEAAADSWRGSNEDLRLSLSIGWAAPEPMEDLDEALRVADGRMYRAKRTASV